MLKNFKNIRPQQCSQQQINYLGTVIRENGHLQNIVEIGLGSGGVAEGVWQHIHSTDKKLLSIDAFFFLPENVRQKHGDSVIKGIKNYNENIQFLLADSISYEWQKNDLVISSHEDSEHFLRDWEKFCKDQGSVSCIVMDINEHCGVRFFKMLEILKDPPHGFSLDLYVDGMLFLSKKPLQCSLPTNVGTLYERTCRCAPKRETTTETHQKHLAKVLSR